MLRCRFSLKWPKYLIRLDCKSLNLQEHHYVNGYRQTSPRPGQDDPRSDYDRFVPCDLLPRGDSTNSTNCANSIEGLRNVGCLLLVHLSNVNGMQGAGGSAWVAVDL